jgi:Indigoidine synthase A like protein
MANGVLFGVPIPSQYHSVGNAIEQATELAIKESEENGMSKRGKEVTPWLLNRVNELTDGKALLSSTSITHYYFLLDPRHNTGRCCADREHGTDRYANFCPNS